MGSLYWRRKARQRGSLAASDSLFGPYVVRRAMTSAAESPAVTSTFCRTSASSTLRACQAVAPTAASAAGLCDAAISSSSICGAVAT